MPIYEYRCQECDAITEAFVRSGKEPTECPQCGKSALSRLISRAGIIFKGSGFYVTDSKSGSSSKSKTASGGESSTSNDSGGEKKSAESTSAGTGESTSSAAKGSSKAE